MVGWCLKLFIYAFPFPDIYFPPSVVPLSSRFWPWGSVRQDSISGYELQVTQIRRSQARLPEKAKWRLCGSRPSTMAREMMGGKFSKLKRDSHGKREVWGGREGSKKIGSVPGFQQHKEGSDKTPQGKPHAWYWHKRNWEDSFPQWQMF